MDYFVPLEFAVAVWTLHKFLRHFFIPLRESDTTFSASQDFVFHVSKLPFGAFSQNLLFDEKSKDILWIHIKFTVLFNPNL